VAHRGFRLINQTAQQYGFQSANAMIEQGHGEAMQGTVYTVAQLSTATGLDCGTVATITSTNAKLAAQLEAAQAYIKKLKDEILDSKKIPNWYGKDNFQQSIAIVLVKGFI
jgi:hypothetical protein